MSMFSRRDFVFCTVLYRNDNKMQEITETVIQITEARMYSIATR